VHEPKRHFAPRALVKASAARRDAAALHATWRRLHFAGRSAASALSSRPTEDPIVRLCTFNVHGWTDARGRSNTQAVIDLLRRLACDVVALNEVPARSSSLARVADELGCHHAFADTGFLGNALLSRHPLARIEERSLASSPGAEERSLLVASVEMQT